MGVRKFSPKLVIYGFYTMLYLPRISNPLHLEPTELT